ncbi:MAG: DUF2332 domain-containing protein [Ilumatobacteraceae bacterium]
MTSRIDLAGQFREFAQTAAHRSPLYGRLATAIADDAMLLGLLDDAPPDQRRPVLLFAAVHHLVLEGHGGELGAHFASASHPSTDPVRELHLLVDRHRNDLHRLITTRSVQTNEVGRCAAIVPVHGAIHREVGATSLVEVGASAGLLLNFHHYAYRYDDEPWIGADAPVRITCATSGAAREVGLPHEVVAPRATLGLDRAPVDLDDPDAVRWLEACMWPEETGRRERLLAAIALARTTRPELRVADAVEDIAGVLEERCALGHPVVLTSWTLAYLDEGARRRFVDELETFGRHDDLSWLILESPADTPGLPIPTTSPPESITVVSLVTWRSGRRSVRRIATMHPHGSTLRWAESS